MKKITIGVDIRDLKIAKTGTKTYLEEFCKVFKQLHSEDCQFYFIDTVLPVYSGKSKFWKYLEHINYQLWKQLSLPIKAWIYKCDILFCTDNYVPLIHLGFQTVPVFHDAFFFENPEHYGKIWLKLYHLTAIPAAKRAAFIVTPSGYSRDQLHKYTGIPIDKFKVVYEGPKSLPSNELSTALLKFNLQPSNYILHVGSMFKRKNIPALIHAFKLLKENTSSSVKLVLAGPSSSNKDSNDFKTILNAIQVNQLQTEVIITGYLTDPELAAIYKDALMYVFPSVNEGFGIPILEAFNYRLPVLIANNTSLPEIGGDAVLSFDPFDITDIYKKMKLVLINDELREELVNKGAMRLNDFSWMKSAIQLVDLFKKSAK